MTTREIAEAVGKPERTVKGWATKAGAISASAGAKLASAGHGKAAEWDLDEACLIIEIGLGKNASYLFRESSKQKAPESIAEIVRATIAAMIPAIAAAIRGDYAPQAMGIQALPAPQIATRDELRRIINKAGRASGDYSGGWNLLYQEIYYRMHRNVKECAKNRDMDTLDYIEAEGILPEVVAIAREIFA
jgi:hypothetical protein